MRHIPTPQLNKRTPYSTTLAEFKTIEPLEQEENKKVTLLNGRKNGLFKRISIGLKDYFQRLARDYAMVAKDVAMDAKERPIKTAVICAALAALIYTLKTNPDQRDLQARLAQLRQQMVLIPLSIHNQKSDNCLEQYTNLLNGNRLDIYNLWFFSLLVQRPYGRKSNFYAAMDRTTRQLPWIEIWKNCLDIGAFGRFWILENSFRDSDIRIEEFI